MAKEIHREKNGIKLSCRSPINLTNARCNMIVVVLICNLYILHDLGLCTADRHSLQVIFYFQVCFHPLTWSSLRLPPEASVPPGQLLLPESCLTWCVSARLKTSLETTFPWQCLVTPPQLFCPTFSPSPPTRSTSLLSTTKETASLWLVKRPL